MEVIAVSGCTIEFVSIRIYVHLKDKYCDFSKCIITLGPLS